MKEKSSVKEKFINLIFPKKCVSCGKWEDFVCSKCFKEIIFTKGDTCPKCNAITNKGRFCIRCRKKFFLTGCLSVGYFKDPIIKELLHNYKYEGVFAISEYLSKLMSEKLLKANLRLDAVTFVPLSKKRKIWRGYNQSELLAKGVAQSMNLPIAELLLKVKDTKTQVGLPKKEREKNLVEVFKVKTLKQPISKRILIIDDVYTTGTTLNECAKRLKEAGAKEVWGLTVAKE